MSVDTPPKELPSEPDAASSPGAIWRRIKRNAGIIVGGRLVFGLLNLAAAALAVRAVGVEAFGVVVLLQAYVRLIAGLLKFQSWSAVTKFGADALALGDEDAFRRLTGFTLRIDMIGFAATIVIGIACVPLAASWLNWPPAAQTLAPWYVLTAPFITAGTPTGVLRLLDRFVVLAQQHGLNAIVRFIGALGLYLAFLINGPEGAPGVGPLILIWGSASLISGMWMILMAWRAARARGLSPQLRGRWSELTFGFTRIWRFVLFLNASSLMEVVATYATVLVVGGLLGPAAAGLFGLVRQITDPLLRFRSILGPVVFPEFAWLEARKDRTSIARVLWRSLAICGAVLLVFCLFLAGAGEWVLVTLFDDQAAPAAPLLTAAGAAAAFVALGFAMEPVLLTLRKERAVMFTAIFSTMLFCAVLWPLIHWQGLLGAGLAMLVRQAVLFFHRLAILYRTLVLRAR